MYTPSQFNRLCEEFLDREQEILNYKRTEYAAGEDRLENFRTISTFLGGGMKKEQVALTYLLKHIQSITVAVQTGSYRWCWEDEAGEGMKQRISDARNYLLLLAAALEEEGENENIE